MAFDVVVANPGSGGASFAFDTFEDTDAVEKVMPYGALAFGSLNGAYTVVTVNEGFPVEFATPESPQHEVLSDSSVAAGASTDLDFTVIANAKTAKLVSAVFGSTAACRWDLKTLDGAVEVTKLIVYTGGIAQDPTFSWRPPKRDYVTLAEDNGDERWRVTVTHLGQGPSAAVSATLTWDEE